MYTSQSVLLLTSTKTNVADQNSINLEGLRVVNRGQRISLVASVEYFDQVEMSRVVVL